MLRLGKERSRFNKLDPGLPEQGLEETTTLMWRSLRSFYREFPDVNVLHIPTFKTWFTEFKHADMAGDKLEMYTVLIERMKEDVPEGMADGLQERLLQSELSVEILTMLQQYNTGAEIDLPSALKVACETYEDRMERKAKTPIVTETIDELMEEDETSHGITWRLHELRKSMRPLRGGDFGIWAARPDRGKTTSLVSECSYWIPQLPDLYPGENRCGMWFNNEGKGSRIKQRYYQAALGCTIPEMIDMHKAGVLHTKLREVLGDDLDRMKFFDIHDYFSHEVDAIIKLFKPAFVIFDMIDNIKFSGMTANNGQRTDQLLEEMYKWGRNSAVKNDYAGIATSQISGDGDGVPFPPQAALKDSKTGKQGACDFIIMWGAVNDPNMDHIRYLGIPKNKLHRPGGRKNPQCEVLFDAERARMKDPED